MARRAAFVWIGTLVVLCLAIGVFWTIRTAPPSPAPWWWGKDGPAEPAALAVGIDEEQ